MFLETPSLIFHAKQCLHCANIFQILRKLQYVRNNMRNEYPPACQKCITLPVITPGNQQSLHRAPFFDDFSWRSESFIANSTHQLATVA
jgi:hypothetical protein